jgi:serine protease
MSRTPRFAVAAATVGAVAILLGSGGRAQLPASSARDVVPMDALTAIDQGVVPFDENRLPDSAGATARMGVRDAVVADRTGAAGSRYVPGRVIVKFRDGASTTDRVSAMSTARSMAATAAIAERPPYANFDIVTIDPTDDPEAVAAAMAARGDVEYAQAAYRLHTMMVPNDPLYARLQWNLPLIDMERAWDIQPQAGSAMVVAVLDTGMAYVSATVQYHGYAWRDQTGTRYPDLGMVTVPFSAAPELAAPGRFVAPYDFIWNDAMPIDTDGHGTHVSGTIGQLTNNGIGVAGVAFNVKLMPVKVIDSTWDDIFGCPNYGTDDTVARGIRYAADNGANVINMSIGRTGLPSPVIEDAIRYAVGKGVFLAIAGGNAFQDGNPVEVVAEIASRVAGAVSVAAVDPARRRSYYSSTGAWVELAAPGGSNAGYGEGGYVWQQTFDYTYTDTFLLPPARYSAPRFDVIAYVGYIGTSMAAPHVAGLAAMLMQQGITAPAAVEAAMEQFATDLGAAGRDDQFGYGLIEARNTLRGLGLAR